MKKVLPILFFVLCFACANENEPLTNTDRDRLKGEANEAISTIIQACENCNTEKLASVFLNSPDFISLINGEYSDYAQTVQKYPTLMSDYKSQKSTIISEKYTVVDATTILYSSKSKWECKLKNDSIAVYDNCNLQLLLTKDENQWKVLSWTESY